MKKYFYNQNDAGKIFLWSVIAPQLLGSLAVFILLSSSASQEAYLSLLENPIVSAVIAMLAQVAFILVYFLFNRKTKFTLASKINFKIGYKNTAILILIAVVGVFGLNFIASVSDIFLQEIGYSLSTSLPLPLNNIGWLFVNILLLALIPAILEELIFRGVILNGFKSNKSKWVAIIITAALFSLIHGSAQQTIFTFVFGLVLGYVAIQTGSVISSMIVHFINNALVVILNYVGFNFDFNLPVWAYVIIALILTAIALVSIYFLGKLLKKVKAKELPNVDVLEIPKQEPVNNTNLYLGILLGLAVWVVEFITYLGGPR